MNFDDLTNKYLTPLLIIFVGFIANLIKVDNKFIKTSIKTRFAILISGAITSSFLCWLAFESALYFTQNQNFSLAIGGFFAWRGADWTCNIIDDFIKNRIIKHNGDDYKPYARRKDDNIEEIDYSEGE